MKTLNLKLAIIITILIIAMITQLPIIPSKVRPITIIVVDGTSKKPISNVLLYYRIDLAGPSNLLGIPIVDPINFRKALIKTYRSDDSGVIIIPGVTVLGKLYEKVYCEKVYLNLAYTNESKENIENFQENAGEFIKYFNIHDFLNTERFFTPLAKYRGFVISSTYHDYDSYAQGGTVRGKFNILWNGRSLHKEKEEVTVELERWEGFDKSFNVEEEMMKRFKLNE